MVFPQIQRASCIFWGRWSGHWFAWWVGPYLFVYTKIIGDDIAPAHCSLQVSKLALVGLQLITTGLIAEMLTRLRSRRQPLSQKIDTMVWMKGSDDGAE